MSGPTCEPGQRLLDEQDYVQAFESVREKYKGKIPALTRTCAEPSLFQGRVRFKGAAAPPPGAGDPAQTGTTSPGSSWSLAQNRTVGPEWFHTCVD